LKIAFNVMYVAVVHPGLLD